jgi:hypothetical protein
MQAGVGGGMKAGINKNALALLHTKKSMVKCPVFDCLLRYAGWRGWWHEGGHQQNALTMLKQQRAVRSLPVSFSTFYVVHLLRYAGWCGGRHEGRHQHLACAA